jgi:CheY-like chemotaxis protein
MTIRVLVVDDDPWILRMVTATLEKRGYVVDTAREGRAALAKAHAARPDVLVTDVMMPVMDGWTLVATLRQQPGFRDIPVILLTALGKDEGRLRQLDLDDDCYLAKPFRFDELEKRVSAATAARKPEPPPPPDPQSGVHPMPGPNPQSGVYPMPGPNPQSGAYPMPGPNPQSGAHPMPYHGYPGYPPQGYPSYPPQPGYPPYGYPGYGPGYPQAPPPGPPAPAPASVHPPAPAPEPAARPASRDPGTGERKAVRRTTALNGRLEQLGLSSLLVMMEMERKDGVLSLKNREGGAVGRIFLRQGQVISAKLDGLDALGGKQSVYEMLSWAAGTFSFSATKVDMEDSIQSSTTHLLMEGARLIDEANRDEGL